ncbi:MAG: universal stress protein [Bacteroidales bacterium]|jgi:nucleotide-binding universal stress UspA family protein
MKGHYNNILVPTDFSEQSLLALEQAYALAQLLNVEITLLYVIPEGGIDLTFGLFSKEPSEKEKVDYEESCFARLQQISESASKNSWIKVNPLIVNGKVHERILQVAKDIYARFIVMATNSSDPDHKKTFIGSNTSKVIKEAPCPVLTFNGTNIREHFDTIVLPLDLTKETQQKIAKAIEIAKYYNSTIRIVSVLLTGEPEVVNQLTEQLKQVKEFIEKRDIYTTAKIIHGDRAIGGLTSFILEYAYESDGDLIMIMTQQEVNLRDRFLGSNASDIISESKIPVLSVVPK